jgi:hypothetical protein
MADEKDEDRPVKGKGTGEFVDEPGDDEPTEVPA